MTCRHVMQLRDAHLDGELSSSLNAEVHAHLLQCPACQKEFEMMRASGDVVAQDKSEPVLDSGFASRVVAALPKNRVAEATGMRTRRDDRNRFRRIAIGTGAPAIAAMLLFSVLIWPTQPVGVVEGYKNNARPMEDFIPQDVHEMVVDGEETIASSKQLIAVAKDAAVEVAEDASAAELTESSLLDSLFFDPFREVLQPLKDAANSDDESVVEF